MKYWKWSIQELTNGRNGCDDLTKLELVEDGSLTSSIKTNHQNSHFFLGEKPAEKFRECQPHFSFLAVDPYTFTRQLTNIHTKIQIINTYIAQHKIRLFITVQFQYLIRNYTQCVLAGKNFPMQILTHKSQNKPRKLLEWESRSHTYMEHLFLADRTDP